MTRLRTALAEPAALASSAWTPPVGALPKVLVHLTPLAPALEGRDLSDDKRWRWLSWVTPAAIMRQVLLRLQRRADQVALRVLSGSDGLEVHDGGDLPPAGCERLLAIIFDAPAASLRTAWAALQPEAEIERHAIEGATVLIFKPKGAA